MGLPLGATTGAFSSPGLERGSSSDPLRRTQFPIRSKRAVIGTLSIHQQWHSARLVEESRQERPQLPAQLRCALNGCVRHSAGCNLVQAHDGLRHRSVGSDRCFEGKAHLQSVAISRNQSKSITIHHNPSQSVAICRNQSQFEGSHHREHQRVC